ncbi:MAG: PqqD family peptide modification chaperone [Gemmatimonadota bacterium]
MNVEGTLTSDTVVTRSEEPVAVEVDRSVVMMSVEQGMYFGLEGAGPRIWALLEEPRSVRQLCDELIHDFAVDPDVCRREVGTFLEELRRAQLVRFDVPPTDPVRPTPGS